jgi:hypothetical protein
MKSNILVPFLPFQDEQMICTTYPCSCSPHVPTTLPYYDSRLLLVRITRMRALVLNL